MKTTLPASINSIEEAKDFIDTLYKNGEAFHPDDDAHDVVFNGVQPTKAEMDKLNILMDEVCSLKWDPFEHLCNLVSNDEKNGN